MDFEIDAEDWPEGDWEQLAASVATAAARIVPELANPRLLASVLFTSDDEIQALNAQWRGKDRPTNVLSFPMLRHADLLALSTSGPPVMLGDIALAMGCCNREASEKGIPLPSHAAHLIVHGLLHLVGFDHETGKAEAIEMEEMETKALAIMGIADPYGDQDQH